MLHSGLSDAFSHFFFVFYIDVYHQFFYKEFEHVNYTQDRKEQKNELISKIESNISNFTD